LPLQSRRHHGCGTFEDLHCSQGTSALGKILGS